MNELNVNYRDISGYPGYRVGDDGSVWSCLELLNRGNGYERSIGSRWKQIKLQHAPSEPYYTVNLHSETRAKTYRVHQLVLEAFVGKAPEGLEACHGDGNRATNALSNLRWDTRRSNCDDRAKHGTIARGDNSPRSKLTSSQVLSIRSEYAAGGINQYELADKYGVCQATIWYVVSRKHWAHL